jgi:hypothetical protein
MLWHLAFSFPSHPNSSCPLFRDPNFLPPSFHRSNSNWIEENVVPASKYDQNGFNASTLGVQVCLPRRSCRCSLAEPGPVCVCRVAGVGCTAATALCGQSACCFLLAAGRTEGQLGCDRPARQCPHHHAKPPRCRLPRLAWLKSSSLGWTTARTRHPYTPLPASTSCL